MWRTPPQPSGRFPARRNERSGATRAGAFRRHWCGELKRGNARARQRARRVVSSCGSTTWQRYLAARAAPRLRALRHSFKRCLRASPSRAWRKPTSR